MVAVEKPFFATEIGKNINAIDKALAENENNYNCRWKFFKYT